ncbi:hypothetical protein B0H19DRAFT_1270384 [Mycena capillaripes]|nr:hypothetical protein B0H19DRAFT_1270384 [Mycena capillaripes]
MLLFRSIQIACLYDTVPSITSNRYAKTLARSLHLVDYICELRIVPRVRRSGSANAFQFFFSALAIWPISKSLTPLLFFVVNNGAANGRFFATISTVVGTVFDSARVSVIVTGWVSGYLMGAPIAGYLLAAYGGAGSTLSAYHPAMFYAEPMGMRLKTSTRLFQKV